MSRYKLTPFAEARLQEILKDEPQYAELFEEYILKGYGMTIGDYSIVCSFFDPLDPPYWTRLFEVKSSVLDEAVDTKNESR